MLAILLCLATGQRDQKISYMDLDLMKFGTVKVTIFVPELLKQARPRYHLVLMRYTETDICALSHQEKYREVTNSIRKSNKPLLRFVKPRKPISTSTFSRWCVSTLQQTAVDITVFGSHSTRSTSTSHYQRKGLSIKPINNSAGWSSVQTSARFYRKPKEEEDFFKSYT